MYAFFAEKLIYPMGDLALGSSVVKYYHWLQKTQWWSPAQLLEMQNLKLRSLIKHAYENVPYYRRLFQNRGWTDKDIQTVDDLQKLPLLTKSDIRQNASDMLAQDFEKWRPIPNATGGSTGEPLKFYMTKEVVSINWAAAYRGWGWAGYRLGDKRITFGGSSLIPDKRPSLFESVRRTLERNQPISAFDIDEAHMRLYLKLIREFQPLFIYGYASALSLMADHLISSNVKGITLKAVLPTAETLLPTYRKVIEKGFNCQVFDQYGSYDGGAQALECATHAGCHISSEKAVVELVDESGLRVPAGQPGRVITTDLYNYVMPFIRYDVGDRATLSASSCRCGRSLPLLQSIQGRVSDFILTPEGTKIHGEFFSHILQKSNVVVQFQVEQASRNELIVRMVPRSGSGSEEQEQEKQRVLELIRLRTGGMKVEIEFVKNLVTTAAGKRKFIISGNTQ